MSGQAPHSYWDQRTLGCVRITEGNVHAVWRRWEGAPNKGDFPLLVIY